MSKLTIHIAYAIMEKYGQDMGKQFDYINGQEETVINEIQSILENGKLKDKIKLWKGEL